MNLLNWAFAFLVVAIVAAILGFGGIAGTAVGIAKIFFFLFLALVVVSLVVSFVKRARSPVQRGTEQ